uniref:Integrator complex subunit 12 n=1 Tax=Glossina brevipalpis TaxID=37001 RepID=A0A1A9W5W4_9MUSC
MSTSVEFEFLLKRAITLLHSSQSNSAFELRQLLDEEIKKRYGSEKMISNNMTKKQLDEEANFPGRAATPPPQPVEEIINLINSPAKTISDSPDTIVDSEDAVSGAGGLLSTTAEDEANLKEFGDLNCCVCGEMMFTATNRLIECCKCGALYHQECHKPLITDDEISDDQVQNWQCDNCVNKPSTAKAAGLVADEPMPLMTNSVGSINKSKSSATSSRSSSSSNSSSPFYKAEHTLNSTATTSRNTSSKTKEEKLSSSSSKCTTAINAGIATSSSSSRKHSSSSPSSNKSKSSSRHHDKGQCLVREDYTLPLTILTRDKV